ncbi:MAG: histone deacetylase family protein [Promethearchaeota archaeon]
MFEIVYHPLYGELHDIGQPRPFFEAYDSPLRCKLTWEYFKQIGFALRDFRGTNIQVNSEKKIYFKKPSALTNNDISLVHSKYHIELVEKSSKKGYAELGLNVVSSEDSHEISLLSAGGAYQALYDVLSRKYPQSFAIIRPPGHHAMPETAEGLCFFNNIGIAIKKYRKDLDYKEKLAILDIDAHYGNGIAKIFYIDRSVLYSSIHEYQFQAGNEGSFSELGADRGFGTNIPFPLPLKANDVYLDMYMEFIEPFLVEYSPDAIIVAIGLDAHWADPVGNLYFTSKSYTKFANWLKRISKNICNSRICFILEGGYNLLMIPRLIENIICEFLDIKPQTPIDIIDEKFIFSKTAQNERVLLKFRKLVNEQRIKLRRIWNLTI